jgi:flotillin
MNIKLAQITAKRQAESKDAELQRDVETKRAEMELEKRRATDLVQAKIGRESAQQLAEAKYFTDTKGADAQLYQKKQEAEAACELSIFQVLLFHLTMMADFRATKEAEAAFYAKKKEAEGITEMARAYGNMADVLGGPQGLLQYMMLQNNTYEKLAKANATAINGLQPKISVWNTGSGESDTSAPIRNLFQSLPPLLSTVHEQTGILPPSWLAQLPADPNKGTLITREKVVNGDSSRQ